MNLSSVESGSDLGSMPLPPYSQPSMTTTLKLVLGFFSFFFLEKTQRDTPIRGPFFNQKKEERKTRLLQYEFLILFLHSPQFSALSDPNNNLSSLLFSLLHSWLRGETHLPCWYNWRRKFIVILISLVISSSHFFNYSNFINFFSCL